jgi:hypothetical protein
MDRPASLEQGEIIDLTGDDDQYVGPSVSPPLTPYIPKIPPLQQHSIPRPQQLRQRSRNNNSRSRSRSPVKTRRDAKHILETKTLRHVTVPPKEQQQQKEGVESEEQHSLTPTERLIRKTVREEASKNFKENEIADDLLRYESTGLMIITIGEET